jgi:uncharacterized protein (DUF58 family)
VVAVGFAGAGLAARGWARAVAGSLQLERRVLPGERVEGADVIFEVRVAHRRSVLGAAVTVAQSLGGVEQSARLRGGRALLTFARLPRGRHQLGPLVVALADPLGLERVEHVLQDDSAILIRPRIPVLGPLFSSHGSRESGAARAGRRRPTGFEVHAVRDYVPGEPLRSVHWPTTARRGRLMVKELEDAPREDVTIVLDQDLAGVAGPAGASSFDAAVRAAGALVLAYVSANRRVALVGTTAAFGTVRVRVLGADWESALDALAAVEPVAGARVEVALGGGSSAVARAREVVVVTARPERVGSALEELRRHGRAVSLVVVASETYADATPRAPRPEVLRAAAHGVSVALVARDVPLETALGRRPMGAVGA